MFVPGVHQHRVRAPRSFVPFVLAIGASLATIVVWAAFSARPISNELDYGTVATVNASAIRSVAYALPFAGYDEVYVRRGDSESGRRIVAAFPYVFSFHVRGEAAPSGSTLAIVSMADVSRVSGLLTFLTLATGERVDAAPEVDYASEMAWSPDGRRLAAVRSGAADTAGRVAASVLEVEPRGGAATVAATFDDVFLVAPVGYSAGGDRLFVVVVDQSGSALWAIHGADRPQRLAILSPGRTRDWSLNSDGSRLAFVEVLSGDRAYEGRVLLIATGAVAPMAANGDRLGVAWQPGAGEPGFGGPGGSIRLSAPEVGSAYLVPVGWSPDGTMLVASVFTPSRAGSGEVTSSIEVVASDRRWRLAEEPGAQFLGWVANLE